MSSILHRIRVWLTGISSDLQSNRSTLSIPWCEFLFRFPTVKVESKALWLSSCLVSGLHSSADWWLLGKPSSPFYLGPSHRLKCHPYTWSWLMVSSRRVGPSIHWRKVDIQTNLEVHIRPKGDVFLQFKLNCWGNPLFEASIQEPEIGMGRDWMWIVRRAWLVLCFHHEDR